MALCISRPLYPCLSVGLSSFSLNGKMSFLHVHPVGLIRPACPSWSGGSESADTHDRRKNQPFGAYPNSLSMGLRRERGFATRKPMIGERTSPSGLFPFAINGIAPGPRVCNPQSHDRRKNQPFRAFPFRYPWACESQTRGPSGAASPPFRDHGSSVLDQGRPSQIRLIHGL